MKKPELGTYSSDPQLTAGTYVFAYAREMSTETRIRMVLRSITENPRYVRHAAGSWG